MKLTCSHDGYWESLVTVENGKIDHNVRWDSNDRLILNGSFDRNGELKIEGRLIFIDHGAQRTWAKAKGRGGKAD